MLSLIVPFRTWKTEPPLTARDSQRREPYFLRLRYPTAGHKAEREETPNFAPHSTVVCFTEPVVMGTMQQETPTALLFHYSRVCHSYLADALSPVSHKGLYQG